MKQCQTERALGVNIDKQKCANEIGRNKLFPQELEEHIVLRVPLESFRTVEALRQIFSEQREPQYDEMPTTLRLC